jgi:hypothetical protein
VVLVRYVNPGWKELLGFLQRDRGWRLVFFDDVASLFVRIRPGEVLPYPEVDLDLPNRFPPVEGSNRERNIRRLGLRIFALWGLGRPDLALEEWDDANVLYPEMQFGKSVRARMIGDARVLGKQR